MRLENVICKNLNAAIISSVLILRYLSRCTISLPGIVHRSETEMYNKVGPTYTFETKLICGIIQVYRIVFV